MTNIVKKYNTLKFAFVLEYFRIRSGLHHSPNLGVVGELLCHSVTLEKRTLEATQWCHGAIFWQVRIDDLSEDYYLTSILSSENL
jgi:hypothetical protein